jgi:phenylacetate-CoA ligase
MRELSLRFYHRLPPGGRNIIATLRGYQLRNWRYGRDAERLVGEAIERETWSAAQWNKWQQERLQQILKRAATQVPYYRDHGPQTTDHGSENTGDWSKLENWPVLKKEAVRSNPRAFLAEGCDPRGMWCEHTSGSTGTPLTLWQSHETVRHWYALFEARWRRWYGLSRADRWAIIGGQSVTPARQTTPPYWVWNGGLKQLYLSAYHLSPEAAKDYIRALRDYGVTYVLGYASALSALARFALDQDLHVPCLKAAISNAEPLFAHQRETIRQAFRCPVYNTYGMSEMVCAAGECQHGTMHLWPETGIWEILYDDSDRPVAPGETGRLVATSLLNTDMPLIRYEVGDRMAMAAADSKCACGRRLPILASVEGRKDDVILTPDGRRIGRLDPVFKVAFPIVESQIIQVSRRHLCVRVIPAAGFNSDTEAAIRRALRQVVGDMVIKVERVSSIPRSANGKLRAVVTLFAHTKSQYSELLPGGAGDCTEPLPVVDLPKFELAGIQPHHLSSVARIHAKAFPDSALSQLGPKVAQSFYEWQMIGPHDHDFIGVFSDGKLQAYAVGGLSRGSISGFVQTNPGLLSLRLLLHPWLVLGKRFRRWLALGLRALCFNKPRRRAPARRSVAQSFGILAIAVDPELQGLGAGKLLMERMEEAAREKRFSRMHLTVRRENSQAIRFYEARGWKKVPEGSAWSGIMQKDLAAAAAPVPETERLSAELTVS